MGVTTEGVILRRDDVGVARRALQSGTGVVVSGAHGTGRSHFVEAVLADLDEATRSRLWLGDNVHRLDAGRAARLADAITSASVVPFVTVLTGEPVPHPLARVLADERIVLRLTLGPVSAHDLLLWTEQLLAAPVDPGSLTGIVPIRGGADVALHRDWLDTARARGTLALVEGRWRLIPGQHPEPRLRALALSRLGRGDGLSPAQESLLELIALAPDLALSSLDAAAARLGVDLDVGEELERLEESGAVEVLDAAREPRVRLRDGIHELVLAQAMGVLRRWRISGVVVDVLDAVPPARLTPRETITLARFSLQLDRVPDAVLVARAAVASFREPDLELTRRLAAAAVDLAGGFDAEMILAATEAQLGHSDLALARLEQLVSEAGDDLERGRSLAALVAQVTERAGQPAWALDIHQAAVSAGLVDPAALLQANASKGLMLQALGDTTGAALLLEPSLDELEGPALLQAHLAVCHEAMFSGAFGRAHASLDAATAVLEGSGQSAAPLQIDRALVLSFEGRLRESLEIVQTVRDAAGSFGQWVPQALCTWGVGGLLLTMGRAAEATRELRSAIGLMEHIGTARSALMVRTDLARALAVTGDAAAAREALAPAMEPSAQIYLDARALQALGWITAAEGRPAEAAAEFLRAADTYRASRADMPELVALAEAARAGSARAVLGRVEAIATTAEGEFVAFTVRHVRALAALETLRASRDEAAPSGPDSPRAAAAGLELAREFVEIGAAASALQLHIVAAEAHQLARMLYAETGDTRAAASAERMRGEQLALCGLESSPLQATPAVAAATAPLSSRELEIASLAAGGRSNREIAALLVLSVRTVETHLQRVYQKLGLRTRAELSTAIGNRTGLRSAAPRA